MSRSTSRAILTTQGRIACRLILRGTTYHYVFHWAGEPRRGTTRTTKTDDAWPIAEREVIRIVESGGKKSLTLERAVADFLEERWPGAPKGNNWFRDNRKALEKFVKLNKGMELSTVELWEVTELLKKHLKKNSGQSLQSKKNNRTILSGFFKWLMQSGIQWPYNPAASDRLRIEGTAGREKLTPTDEEIEKLLKHCKATKHKIYPMLILVLSGARRVGASRFQWRDIQPGGSKVIEKPHVNKEERTVFVNSWALNELAAFYGKILPCADPNLVWPYNVDYATGSLQDVRDELGLSAGITFAGLRRAVEAKLDAAEVNPHQGAAIMNHSISTADQKYRKKRASDAAGAAAEILTWKSA